MKASYFSHPDVINFRFELRLRKETTYMHKRIHVPVYKYNICHAESAIAYIVQVVYGIFAHRSILLTQEWYMCRVSKYVKARRVLQHSVAVSEADVDASKKPVIAKNTEVAFSVTFFTLMGFLLASTSASEAATKVQLFVTVSVANVDASKKTITAQNTEVAFSAFFTVMGLLLASTSASETATNAALRAVSFDTSSESESLSQWFQGCFNSLGNFDIAHKSERGLWQRRQVACP